MFETSELNITYFLGAGASAKALPTIKDTALSTGIATRLNEVANQLINLEYAEKYKKYVSELIENLRLISEKTIEFGTPDTYAKFLFLTEKEKLIEFKNALSAYFLIEQFLNKKIDNRALVFLTTILERNIFPENIKILSWNYDFQLQLAAETFREERFTHTGSSSSYKPSLIGYFPKPGYSGHITIKDISMVQLNGIAGSYRYSGMFRSFFERKEERTLDHLLQLLSDESFYEGSLLTFAWEQDIPDIKNELIKDIAINTDVLVIIGYSFPFFNRRIDKEIFDAMKDGKLKTIYYQDPFKSGEFLRNQFELGDNVVIKDVKEIENYFVPLEL